jgi:hypothetical protein
VDAQCGATTPWRTLGGSVGAAQRLEGRVGLRSRPAVAVSPRRRSADDRAACGRTQHGRNRWGRESRNTRRHGDEDPPDNAPSVSAGGVNVKDWSRGAFASNRIMSPPCIDCVSRSLIEYRSQPGGDRPLGQGAQQMETTVLGRASSCGPAEFVGNLRAVSLHGAPARSIGLVGAAGLVGSGTCAHGLAIALMVTAALGQCARCERLATRR